MKRENITGAPDEFFYSKRRKEVALGQDARNAGRKRHHHL
jgi:hypothetical protein